MESEEVWGETKNNSLKEERIKEEEETQGEEGENKVTV